MTLASMGDMRWTLTLTWTLFLGLILLRVHDRFFHPTTSITFFDVGQGDSALVELPGHRRVLVDSGRRGIGKMVLLRELTRKSILTLDVLLLSHLDTDHSEGLESLPDSFFIREIWLPSSALQHPHFPTLHALTEKRRIPIRWFAQDETIRLGETEWRLTPGDPSLSANESGLVAQLTWGRCSALFTGDIGRERESVLGQAEIASSFLKVAHHGSRFSSGNRFLESARPLLGVVSNGLRNVYGHPHPDAIQRIQNRFPLLRTDFHGFVEVDWDYAGHYRCRTGNGKCGEGQCSVAF